MVEIIKFYRASGKYGFLSNLFKKPMEFEGRFFPVSEYAYQYGRFRDERSREWAMRAPKFQNRWFLGYWKKRQRRKYARKIINESKK